MNNVLKQLYFSPSGTTEKISNLFCSNINWETTEIDLLHDDNLQEVSFEADDYVVVTLPVFAGRIPSVCSEILSIMEGNGAKAVAIVVYGNRDYDDALLELVNLLKEQNFNVISAAAFVAHHSIFTNVAVGRPDAQDLHKIAEFAKHCKEDYEKDLCGELKVNGNYPYKEVGPSKMKPEGDTKCIKCQACVNVCPVFAINAADPRVTDMEKCISCTACITHCPVKARAFPQELYNAARGPFEEKNSRRKEPEFFYL
ncbi:4Fe-4S binding protein [Breznakia pachnodae]|uniref:Ferredoxin n=1 Tax=Breznakia pachnodae TaxID=265178 RepID=A0ABU0E6Q0_9FIRM|nr:4Fe-4S binding protein [Breznakia pachnodae]MDQ0362391.1 ferredoxin [Breznakia pachnodae]